MQSAADSAALPRKNAGNDPRESETLTYTQLLALVCQARGGGGWWRPGATNAGPTQRTPTCTHASSFAY